VIVSGTIGFGRQKPINNTQIISEASVQDVNELKLLLDSRIPLVVIETFEEKKALDVLAMVANNQGRDLHRWSVTDGLTRINFGPQLVPKGSELNQVEDALKHIKNQTQPGIYALCDINTRLGYLCALRYSPFFRKPTECGPPLKGYST